MHSPYIDFILLTISQIGTKIHQPPSPSIFVQQDLGPHDRGNAS